MPLPSQQPIASTIRIVQESDDHFQPSVCASPLTMDGAAHMPEFWTTDALASQQEGMELASTSNKGAYRPNTRPRTSSAIQKYLVDNNRKITGPVDEYGAMRRAGHTVLRAITIPAWQFYRLIPFSQREHGTTEPSSDHDVISQLEERPVVGICLKRYLFQDGLFKKHRTPVDIPDSMSLPHYLSTEDELGNEFNRKYKLVLQSVVCHRGESMHSGHYITFARIAPKLLTDNRRHIADPPPDYEEAQWVRFDDLSQDTGRVVCVDNIRTSLSEEMPYLLFYQIVPIIDIPRSSVDNGSSTEPPSYNESTFNADKGETETGTGSSSGKSESFFVPTISPQTSGYFDGMGLPAQSTGPSIRLSIDQPGSRSSVVEDTGSLLSPSRRDSTTQPDLAPHVAGTATPPVIPSGQESPAHKFRAGVSKIMSLNRLDNYGDSSGRRMSAMLNKMVRPGSKEMLQSDTAPEIPQSSPKRENGLDGSEVRRSHERKEKKSKSKKEEAKSRTSEKAKVVPERECNVM